MLQCNFCSAAFRKLQRNFRFRLWRVAGVGFRGMGFRACRNLVLIVAAIILLAIATKERNALSIPLLLLPLLPFSITLASLS